MQQGPPVPLCAAASHARSPARSARMLRQRQPGFSFSPNVSKSVTNNELLTSNSRASRHQLGARLPFSKGTLPDPPGGGDPGPTFPPAILPPSPWRPPPTWLCSPGMRDPWEAGNGSAGPQAEAGRGPGTFHHHETEAGMDAAAGVTPGSAAKGAHSRASKGRAH